MNLFWFASSEYGFIPGSNVDEESYTSVVSWLINAAPALKIIFIPVIMYTAMKVIKTLMSLKVLSPKLYEFYVAFLLVILMSLGAVPVIFKSLLLVFIMGIILESIYIVGLKHIDVNYIGITPRTEIR
jgi:hypothetical protein